MRCTHLYEVYTYKECEKKKRFAGKEKHVGYEDNVKMTILLFILNIIKFETPFINAGSNWFYVLSNLFLTKYLNTIYSL